MYVYHVEVWKTPPAQSSKQAVQKECDMLARWGAAGWQLISVVGNVDERRFYFKAEQ